MEGIRAAKAKGKHLGRPARLTGAQVNEIVALASGGGNRTEIGKQFGVSRGYIYKLLERHRDTPHQPA